MGELYGEINKLTMEWRDGLMAITVRVCVQVGAPELYGFRSKLFFFTLNRQAMWAGLWCAPVSKIAGKADREKLRRNRAGPRERRRSGAF